MKGCNDIYLKISQIK